MGRVRLNGPPPNTQHTPTIAFTVDGVSSIEVAKKLAARGVFVSHGDFYALTVTERLGQAPHGLVSSRLCLLYHRRGRPVTRRCARVVIRR